MKKLPCLLTAIVCGLCSVAHASFDMDYSGSPSVLGWEESYLYYNASIAPSAPVPGTGEGYTQQKTAHMPGIGMGFRQRLANQFGWDTAFNIRTAGIAHQMDVSALAHYYLQASHQDSMYVGTGFKLGSTWTNENKKLRHFWCVDSVIGKVLTTETSTRHFVELHLECPTHKSLASTQYPYHKDTKLRASAPVVYLSYGMAF